MTNFDQATRNLDAVCAVQARLLAAVKALNDCSRATTDGELKAFVDNDTGGVDEVLTKIDAHHARLLAAFRAVKP